MNDIKAIERLGLNESFTGAEEYRTYRSLVKKHHPDLFKNFSEEEKGEADAEIVGII